MKSSRAIAGILLVLLMFLPLVPNSVALSNPHAADANIWISKFHPELLSKILSGEIKDNDIVTVLFRLQPLPSYTSNSVRGDYNKAVTALKSWASITQEPFILEVYKKGGVVLNTFWLDNVVLVRAKLSVIKELSADPNVVEVFENFKVKVIQPVKKNYVRNEDTIESWGIFKINATEAWNLGYTGKDIRIAILDTGVDITHPALEGKMLTVDPGNPYYPGGWMEFDENGNPVLSQPHDTDGHGTHTSGTALGGDTTNILIGVAPDATLMHGLVLPGGTGSFAQVLAGIQWAVEPFYLDPDTGEPVFTGKPAHVISMSLGATGYYENDLLPGIEAALLANIVVVAAIGNDGQGISSNPGNIWGVFGVGATQQDDSIAYFSSGEVVNWPDPPEFWPFYDTYPSTYMKPDFSAPGVDITSSVPGGEYEAWSGTSMATPHVAGTVALILQASGWYMNPVPDIPEKVYEILKNSSVDLGDPGQDTEYGYGRINALAAVEIAQQFAKKSGVQGVVLDSIDNQPVPWTTITVVETGDTYHVLADGSFKIPLDPGNYTLVFDAWGYVEKTIQVTVELYNGTIAGFVFDYLSQEPIQGAQVSIVEAGVVVYTNESGYFEASVQPGTYTLEVTASGYNPYNTTVHVEENETVLVPIPLTPSGSGTIEGYVFDNTTGDPLANATVVVDNGPLMAVTNETGYFIIENVPAGDHIVTAYKTGYFAQSINVTVEVNQTIFVSFYLEPVPPSIVVVGNVKYYSAPHLAEVLSVLGYPVVEYDDVADLIDDWVNFAVNPVAIVVDHFKEDPYELPSLEEVLALMYLADTMNTPLVFLGTSYAGVTAMDVLIEYHDDIEEAGYPAPISSIDNYPSPEYVKILMLNTTHPIFNGVVPDNDSWFYLADLDESFYADYLAINWSDNSSVSVLANLVDDYNSVNESTIAEWTTASGVKWLYLSTFGESYWMQYIEPGSDGLYSENAQLVLVNSVDYAIQSVGAASLNEKLAIKKILSLKEQYIRTEEVQPLVYKNLTVLLDRLPFGFVEGQLVGSDGMLLAGAKITVLDTPIVHYADENGSFKFWLPEGTYVIEFSAPGYKTMQVNVTIVANTTTGLGTLTMQYVPRIAILYDYQGQLKDLIMSELEWYAEDFNDPISFAEALSSGFYNAGIWAGYYFAPFPSYDEFMTVWETINETGISMIFLDQWSSPYYPDLFGYGINSMHTYLNDPVGRVADDAEGGIYIEIIESSPLFEGYKVGDIIQVFYENLGGYGTDYAAFSGFSGTTLATLLLEDGTTPGDAIAYKVLDSGAKIILLAGWAPEEYQDIEFWTPDAINIFLNAVKWSAQKPFNITPEQIEAHVGDSVTFRVSELPADYDVNVFLDGDLIGAVHTDANGTAVFEFNVPIIPGGSHIVSFVGSDELYRSDATLIVKASVKVCPSNVTSPGTVSLNMTGLHEFETVMIYIDYNFIGTATAKDNGQAKALINIPLVVSGPHYIRVLDISGKELANWSINVSSELEDMHSQIQSILINTETLIELVSSTNASLAKVISDASGNIYAVINMSNEQILAKLYDINTLIETDASELQSLLNDMQGNITTLIKDEVGNVYALVNTSNGQILVKLDNLSSKVDEGFSNLSSQITTSEQNIINQINELKGLITQNTSQLSQEVEEAKSTASTGVKVGGAALVFSLAGIAMIVRSIRP